MAVLPHAYRTIIVAGATYHIVDGVHCRAARGSSGVVDVGIAL
jgi:hypothetical protein